MFAKAKNFPIVILTTSQAHSLAWPSLYKAKNSLITGHASEREWSNDHLGLDLAPLKMHAI